MVADDTTSDQTFLDEDNNPYAPQDSLGAFWYTTNMILTINGKEGSGKTTVAKQLAEKLGYKRYYVGGMRRDAARKKGMTLEEFNTWSETHPEGDTHFDEMVTKLGNEENNFIIESRTAFHFIPHSIKIYLDVDLDIAARRIFNDDKLHSRNERDKINSLEEIKKGLQARTGSDNKRYKQYYDLDIHNPKQYDIVLDTSTLPPDAVTKRILNELETREGKIQ